MTNNCYDNDCFRGDVLEIQDPPYHYDISCFDENLVAGVPITRNCLDESCFEVELARGLLTKAFSSIYFDPVYFYKFSLDVIVKADVPIPFVLTTRESTPTIGSIITHGTPGLLITKDNENDFSVGSEPESDTPQPLVLNRNESFAVIGTIVEALYAEPMILNVTENETSVGTIITCELPKPIELQTKLAETVYGIRTEGDIPEPLKLNSTFSQPVVGSIMVSEITNMILNPSQSTVSVGSIAESEGTGELDLNGFTHEVYHVIRDTIERLSLKGVFDMSFSKTAVFEERIDKTCKIEVVITKKGIVDVRYVKNGVIEFSKRLEVKL